MLKLNEKDQGSPMERSASWVEWQQETCRGGRELITAINRRAGHAMYFDPASLDSELWAELEQCDESTSDTTKRLGAGLVYFSNKWERNKDFSAFLGNLILSFRAQYQRKVNIVASKTK